jgi:hypothetical protein
MNIPQGRENLTADSAGEIADIAEIARDRKGKTIPRIGADKRGSGNQNLTAETRRRGENQCQYNGNSFRGHNKAVR